MSRRSFAITIVIALVVLLVGAGAVYAFDASREDHIAKGMRIGGVDVGGMSAASARAKLREQLVAPLERKVTIQAGARSFNLTAREAHVQVNTDELVDQAVSASREGSFLSRAWRDLTGGKLERQVAPTIGYSKASVQRLVDRVRVAMTRPAQDASVDIKTTDVEIKRSKTGRSIDAKALRARVQAALDDVRADRTMRVKLDKVQPKVTTDELSAKYPAIITVDRGNHRLRLFKHLKLATTYPIAVGQAGLETPAGMYTIQNMQVNPSWHVPDSPWAGDLAGKVIPPGPDDPIKSRWMGIYNGAGIHGTDDVGSIGSNASHGCIRMRIPDVEALYDQVKVGTPVYIV